MLASTLIGILLTGVGLVVAVLTLSEKRKERELKEYELLKPKREKYVDYLCRSGDFWGRGLTPDVKIHAHNLLIEAKELRSSTEMYLDSESQIGIEADIWMLENILSWDLSKVDFESDWVKKMNDDIKARKEQATEKFIEELEKDKE